MSTKIYNGYKLPAMSGTELRKFCLSLKEKVWAKAKVLHQQTVLRDAVHRFDLDQLGIEIAPNRHFLSAAAQRMIERQQTIREKKTRDPEVDLDCNVVFFPFNDFTLAILYTEKFRDLWESMPGVEFFGYWNNTDPPDEITDEEWDERGKLWDDALGDTGVPISRGLTFDCFGIYEGPAYPHKDSFKDYLPTPDERARPIVFNQMVKERVAEPPITDHDVMDAIWEVRDDPALPTRIEALKPQLKEIEWDDLCPPSR